VERCANRSQRKMPSFDFLCLTRPRLRLARYFGMVERMRPDAAYFRLWLDDRDEWRLGRWSRIS
jgi:hypothetical protein